MRIATVAACMAGVVVSGCGAGFARLGTYGNDRADAKTQVDGREYALHVHDEDDTILIQRGFGAAMGQSLVGGATFGVVNMQEPMPVWRAAARWLLEPAGCEVVEIYQLERISYEAVYRCPDGVDLRQMVTDQRERLRNGLPLIVD